MHVFSRLLAVLSRFVSLGAVGAVLAALAAPIVLAAPAAMSQTNAQFCSEVQRTLTGAALSMSTRVHTRYEDFVQSKPKIRPLEAQQYVQYEDAAQQQPMRISCKTKTADHINAEYGLGSAPGGGVGSCRDINRSIIVAAWSSMPPNERQAAAFPPWRVMLDGDRLSFMGNRFIAPYNFVYRGADGRPHVLSKALLVNWDDWVWKLAPDRVRGTHYCHLIAPEYARRLMSGTVRPEASAAD